MMTPHQRWCVYDVKNRRHMVTKNGLPSSSLPAPSLTKPTQDIVKQAHAPCREAAPLQSARKEAELHQQTSQLVIRHRRLQHVTFGAISEDSNTRPFSTISEDPTRDPSAELGCGILVRRTFPPRGSEDLNICINRPSEAMSTVACGKG